MTIPICEKLRRPIPPYERDVAIVDGRVLANPDGPEAAAIIEALVEAGQGIIDRMSDTLRNGKGVEADDGEKCFIVHSDDIEDLRAALSRAQVQP